ncbi:MAG: hypothetical protein LH615_09510, partial [Ferruginibacter sp.]|nr:hypothetical protein [Ferruginibacter sp.]
MNRIIKNIGCLLLLTVLTSYTMAQNNAIFKGGTADGWVSQKYTQNSSNIFKGGIADGWVSLNYSQQTSNIFKGGTADGWDAKNYVQSSASIFKGGIGDGWDAKNYVQSSVGIFKGGIGDGWDTKNYVQSSAGIFKGGFGDGWASSYLPQGPLPVTFLYFTAQKQGNNAAVVQWRTGSETNTAYFDVERSADAVNFEFTGKVFASGNASGMSYSFTDYHPLKGINYYRLKQVDKNNRFVYTPA